LQACELAVDVVHDEDEQQPVGAPPTQPLGFERREAGAEEDHVESRIGAGERDEAIGRHVFAEPEVILQKGGGCSDVVHIQ